tara:strand:- start:383 stop:658 length:276 start_codon:yes stop_codon:yes gene_type:complete
MTNELYEIMRGQEYNPDVDLTRLFGRTPFPSDDEECRQHVLKVLGVYHEVSEALATYLINHPEITREEIRESVDLTRKDLFRGTMNALKEE